MGSGWVFEHVEAAIILEDDCVPGESFFNFCSIMLNAYRDDNRVMMITGTNLLFDDDLVEESYYFSQFFSIWGWATWRRSWSKYDITMSRWPEFKSKKMLESVSKNKLFREYLEMIFDEIYQGKDDTWDYQWFFSGLVQRGLCIVPAKNLIRNIGIDGTRPQKGEYMNRKTSGLNLVCIKEPGILVINPAYEVREIKNILKIAGYSYTRHYIIKILKKTGVFEFLKQIKNKQK